MSSKLCPFCMRMTDSETCPHCGKNVNYAGSTAHLPAGYVVSGKHPYVLGAALGQGGFGITYIALDMVTSKRVAIKEYYPTYCSVRSNAATVAPYTNQEEVYVKGKERFLDEARTLKSLSDLKSIVNVLDFFEANNTAYLVMEFLDGQSLKEHAAKNGKFPARQFLDQIRPLMEDIHRMHERGVIHRDIAPDNIILLPDGQMKLIDFGAARSYVGDKSMTVVVKKGFAPVEQYFSSGSAPSTDVYALAATIYYCITGKVPMESAQRQYVDTPLESPSSLGAEITPSQEDALIKAMEIQQNVRIQSVQEFLDNLLIQKPVQQKTEQPKPVHQKPVNQKPEKQNPTKQNAKEARKPSGKKWIPITAAVAILVVLILGGWFGLSGKDAAPAAEPASTAPVIPPDNWENNILMADPLSALPQISKANIQSVTFLDTCADAPEDAWDVSEAKNGTVLAWTEKNGSYYKLYLAGEGGINGQNACEKLFADCTSMESVHFGNAFYTDYAVSMQAMFAQCRKLSGADTGSWDTSRVTNMEQMFLGCSDLTTLDVSKWDTSHVTNIGSIFSGCSSLSGLDVSRWDLSHVPSMEKMFWGCSSLKAVDVSEWDISGTTNMDGMFFQCETLSEPDFSNWDVSHVESYEDFMSDGKQINGKPWKEFFLSSKWLDNLLMADPLSALPNIPRDKILNVTFLDTCADAPEDAWDVSEDKNRTVLAWSKKNGSTYDVWFAGEGGINAANACSSLFLDCSSLESVQFGNAFHTDYAVNMSAMFKNCNQLTEVDVGNWDTSCVTDMSDMFCISSSYNKHLKTLDVSGWDTACVTDMSRMFYACGMLTSLDVSGWDTSNVTTMAGMFGYCINLSRLDVGEWDTSNVTSMDCMFQECYTLTTLDVSGWDTSSVTDMFAMFSRCSSLTTLDISNWDVSNVQDYRDFMSIGKTVNGRPWQDFFTK